MRRLHHALRAVAVAVVLILPGLSAAGSWERLDNSDYTGCDFRFSGVIQKGDLTTNRPDLTEAGWMVRLCLDSEGGSLGEVYAFLGAINRDDTEDGVFVSTRIERDAVCLSSCAILFMFGQSFGANSPYPSRQMEPGAQLGFHSPFIAPDRAEGADAAYAFQVALQVSKLLVDSAYAATTTAGPPLPPELLALVLGTPAEQMRHVAAYGEMRILGIEVLPDPEVGIVVENVAGGPSEVIERICASSHVLSNRPHFVDDGYDFGDLMVAVAGMVGQGTVEMHDLWLERDETGAPQRISAVVSGPYHVPGWNSVGAQLFCRVDLNVEDAGGDFRVSSYGVGFHPFADLGDPRAAPETWEMEYPGFPAGLMPIETVLR